MHDEPDPIAVILGASSLDEVTTGIDELSRATAQNRRLAAEAHERARRLRSVTVELARRREHLAAARAQAREAAGRLEAAVAGRRGTLASIRAHQAMTAQRLASLQAAAHAAEQRSETLASAAASRASTASSADGTATTGAAAAAPVPASGPRTLVVDAVAYHLPGSTASGIPVGVGVVAVDPTVIPLGTRLFVPGYGPAVAADVGSSVRGAIIDLWMPTTKEALAWGRRTVTITVYR
jgi:3D (Asp-Asp-Asp) domain-containing protein